MPSEIVEAKKTSSPFAYAPVTTDENQAVSMRLSWDAVTKLVDIGVPLRRPTRTTPAATSQMTIIGELSAIGRLAEANAPSQAEFLAAMRFFDSSEQADR